MMRLSRIALAALAGLAGLVMVPALAHAADWEIDSAHSAAQFSVRHMMVSNVKGELGKVSGVVRLDDKDVTKSSVEATIDVNGINTREAKRDQHLKSPDFFDVAKYPSITFKSKKVQKAGAGKLKLTGDLTLHGVTKEIVLDVVFPPGEIKDPYGNLRRGASATAKLSRKDFGLKWNAALEGGGVVVGDEIAITVDVEMTRKAQTAEAK